MPAQLPPSFSYTYATSRSTGIGPEAPVEVACWIEISPPSGATLNSAIVREGRCPSRFRRARPCSSIRASCSNTLCPNGSINRASRRWSNQENLSRVRNVPTGPAPLTGSPRSSATSWTTSSRAPAGSIDQFVRRIGRVAARSTERICASCRRIRSYTNTEFGHASSRVSSAPPSTEPHPPIWSAS